MQLTLEDYARIQRESVSAVRLSLAKEVTQQAEELLRSSEHHDFKSAVDLIMRLRAEEPYNSGVRQQVSEAIQAKASEVKK